MCVCVCVYVVCLCVSVNCSGDALSPPHGGCREARLDTHCMTQAKLVLGIHEATTWKGWSPRATWLLDVRIDIT